MGFYVLDGSALRVAVWDLEVGRLILDTSRRMIWTPGNRLLASDLRESNPVLIDPVTGVDQELPWKKPAGDAWFYADPSERLLAMLGRGSRDVLIIELDSGKIRYRFSQSAGSHECAWRSDGRMLAVTSEDDRVYIYDMVAGRLQSVLEGHRGNVLGVRFSPTDDLVMSHSWDGMTRFWDAVSGRALVEIQGRGLEFSRDGRRVAATFGQRIGLWEIAGGRECRMLHHGQVGNRTDWLGFDGPNGVSFSPDGGYWLRRLVMAFGSLM
jgi:WD40 repeat protein